MKKFTANVPPAMQEITIIREGRKLAEQNMRRRAQLHPRRKCVHKNIEGDCPKCLDVEEVYARSEIRKKSRRLTVRGPK